MLLKEIATVADTSKRSKNGPALYVGSNILDALEVKKLTIYLHIILYKHDDFIGIFIFISTFSCPFIFFSIGDKL